MKTNSLLYRRDKGSEPLDFNHLYDIFDNVFKKEEVPYKDAERYMYQYLNAYQNYRDVMNRYEYLTEPRSCFESRFIVTPTLFPVVVRDEQEELKTVEKILAMSEMECKDAKRNVAAVIHRLKRDKQKYVMVAHYICGASWKRISEVQNRGRRASKDVHNTAMAFVEKILSEEWDGDDATAVKEVDDLSIRWKVDEHKYELEKEKVQREPVEDVVVLVRSRPDNEDKEEMCPECRRKESVSLKMVSSL